MSIEVLLKQLIENNVKLSVIDNKLMCQIPDKGIDDNLLDQLKANKNEIKLILEKSHQTKAKKIIPIERTINANRFPLSFSQQRIWLLDQIEGSLHYNIVNPIYLKGSLDINYLEKSFKTIIERHEVLRTNYDIDERGIPFQKVRLVTDFSIDLINIQDIHQSEKQRVLNKLIEEDTKSSFNLKDDILIRVKLLKIEDNEYVANIIIHHIVTDGWSMGILIKEFCILYTSLVNDKKPDLPNLEIQYIDYSDWQQKWFKNKHLESLKAYWLNQLSDLPTSHNLPLDFIRPKTKSFFGKTLSSEIDTSLLKEINKICKAEQVTLFMVLFAAFTVLICRHSRSTDIVVGTPIANREQTEIANLLGLFMNMLVLRINLKENYSFLDLIHESKKMLIDAYAHQQMPFDLLVSQLQPTREVSISPLFQLMFVLQNNKKPEFLISDMELKTIEFDKLYAQYDLTLIINEDNEKLHLDWEYNTQIFKEVTIKRLSSHYESLLQTLVKRPETNILEAEMLLPEEKHRIIDEFNATEVTYETGRTIHELIEEQCKKCSEKICIIESDGKKYTYEEMNSDVDVMALSLESEEGQLIGILSEKGYNQVVGTLGIMKSGHAYLPLSAEWPLGRIMDVLEAGEVRMIIISAKMERMLGEELKKRVKVKIIEEQIGHGNSIKGKLSKKLPEVRENDVAYVIFTSGSTGKPKGVTISHGGALNTLYAINEKFGIKSDDKVLALSELSFDLSVYDIFGLLMVGGMVVFPSQEELRNISHWIELVDRYEITIWNTVPQLCELMISELENRGKEYLSIRLYLLSGDWIPLRLPERIKARKGDPVVMSLGGATEGSIWSIWYEVKEVCQEWQSIPYGLAMPNQKMYVLDINGNHLPIGITGGIYIGGKGVALNYWNDEEKTSKSFIEHKELGRIYKTGDNGRWNEEGYIEFLGREDQQVKVRGYRVELGEIETAISKYAQGRCQVAVEIKEIKAAKQIVAYYTKNEDIEMDALKKHLQSKLPAYMVPRYFIEIAELPLTSNGKVDRNSLPDVQSEMLHGDEYVPPSNEIQKKLITIWQDILGVEKIGINDNFFELGGDSLKAMIILNAIKKEFDSDINIQNLYLNSTINEIYTKIAVDQKLKVLNKKLLNSNKIKI